MLSTTKTPYILALFFSILLLACEVDNSQTLENRSYRLTWNEEFDDNAGTSVNSDKWSFDIGRGDDGWGNQELQFYTDDISSVSHDGQGNLIITARNDGFGGTAFTSGRIKTEGLFSQKYGRFEARIKTPHGPGIWPAFWVLGDNEETWPQKGEIDIMEMAGQFPNQILGSMHGPGYSGGASISSTYTLDNDRFDADYHVFAIDWGPDYVEYFVDDFLYQRITPEDVPGDWVYDQEYFIILNVAVGGSFAGFPTSDTPFPQEMIIDYVRVFEIL